MHAVDFSGDIAIVCTSSQASNMVTLFPCIVTIPVVLCCPPVATSTQLSITNFIKGQIPTIFLGHVRHHLILVITSCP